MTEHTRHRCLVFLVSCWKRKKKSWVKVQLLSQTVRSTRDSKSRNSVTSCKVEDISKDFLAVFPQKLTLYSVTTRLLWNTCAWPATSWGARDPAGLHCSWEGVLWNVEAVLRLSDGRDCQCEKGSHDQTRDLFYQAVKSCPRLTRSLSLKSTCIVSKAVPAAEWVNARQMSRFMSRGRGGKKKKKDLCLGSSQGET